MTTNDVPRVGISTPQMVLSAFCRLTNRPEAAQRTAATLTEMARADAPWLGVGTAPTISCTKREASCPSRVSRIRKS